VDPVIAAAFAGSNGSAVGSNSAAAAAGGGGGGPSVLFGSAAEFSEQRDAAADAEAARARPLVAQLQHLAEQCEAAFERPQQIISAAMGQVLQLQLVDAAGCSGGCEASGGGGSSEGLRVSAGAPLQAACAADQCVWFTACLPAKAGGQQRILVVRLEQQQQQQQEEDGGAESPACSTSCGGVTADACLLSCSGVVDVGPYKAQQLAVLYRDEGAGGLPRCLGWGVCFACLRLRVNCHSPC